MDILTEEDKITLAYAKENTCNALMVNMVELVGRLVSEAEATAKLFNGPLAGPVAKS